jgi:hypothetical protein
VRTRAGPLLRASSDLAAARIAGWLAAPDAAPDGDRPMRFFARWRSAPGRASTARAARRRPTRASDARSCGSGARCWWSGIGEADLSEAQLVAPPRARSAHTASYCPVCQSEFVVGAWVCPECRVEARAF